MICSVIFLLEKCLPCTNIWSTTDLHKKINNVDYRWLLEKKIKETIALIFTVGTLRMCYFLEIVIDRAYKVDVLLKVSHLEESEYAAIHIDPLFL